MDRKNLKEGLSLIVGELVDRGLSLEQASREFERQFILRSIESHRGNLSRSAEAMGVHRNTLRNKVNRLGIEDEELSKRRRRRRRPPRERPSLDD